MIESSDTHRTDKADTFRIYCNDQPHFSRDPELTTAFVQLPIRYWRLRVRADVPGVDLDTSLLLPVYA